MTKTFALHRLTHERWTHFDNHFLRLRFHRKTLKNTLSMEFIHALSIAQITDRVQHSLIRMKRWRIAPCLLTWGITLKVTCALLPYLRISNFGINKIHLFSLRIDWLFRQSTTATMLCWFEREKHQLRVPIRHIDSCQIHILDMVIGSMYSRASSASQS